MIPLVDLHCHLLAGLDDGPRTLEAALEMCALASAEGVRLMAATAHQNPRWPAVTPERIRQGTASLQAALRERGLTMDVFACAEVMAQPDTIEQWRLGNLLSVADGKRFLLLEMPRGIFVDLLPMVRRLRQAGIRSILAHPEREPQFLYEEGIETLIEAGALVQVSTSSVTDPKTRADRRALKSWFRRGLVHFLGSDGHSPERRRPHMANAYQEVVRWVGPGQADRIASANGMAVAHGLPLRVPRPAERPAQAWWFLSAW